MPPFEENAPCPGSGANAIIGGRHLPCADCGRVVYVPTTGIVPEHQPKEDLSG